MIKNPRKPVLAFSKPFVKLLCGIYFKLPLVDKSAQIYCVQGYTAASNSVLMPVNIRIVFLQE